MAIIDPKDDCVVIRVVYDGAPMAGKTTSVATLGRGLGTEVYSPANLSGRTLYFDWLDYTGGLFEGRRIRCQIVSVPGQATLAPRRRRLLESADAVVFVGDSSPTGFEADRRYLGGLRGVLKKVSGPPIGIVLQANKRDLPDAVPLPRLRAVLDELELHSAIIESIATTGTGIRETFVFAVRLALDRVRELMTSGQLATVQPKVNSAQDLLQELLQAEQGALKSAAGPSRVDPTRRPEVPQASLASQAFQEAMLGNVDAPVARTSASAAAGENPAPAAPDATVASGMVWPPVDGRTILHETSAEQIHLQRAADGSWSGIIDNRWSLHSAAHAVFDNVEAGRAALVEWARQHVAIGQLLSKQRCIVLAGDGQNRFRLWQIVRVEAALRDRMEQALLGDAGTIADALLTVARSFLQMAERVSTAVCELRLTLSDIGAASEDSVYLGHMPGPLQMQPARQWSSAQASELLLSQLAFAQPTLRARRGDVLAELSRIARQSAGQSLDEWHLLQRLAALARE